MKTNFPDKEYLQGLVDAHKERIVSQAEPIEQLVMWSGSSLNWIGDAFTDLTMAWTKRELRLSELYLTGTNPEWNAVIGERANHSADALREIFASEPETVQRFASAKWSDVPILVRAHKGHLKVFDGMHRVIAAVRDGRETVSAWVGERDESKSPQPACESHVVYDLIRAYQTGANNDRAGLVMALRFLRDAYGNVDQLLAERFGPGWIPDDEIQEIIGEARADIK